jgi:hypothetical protein
METLEMGQCLSNWYKIDPSQVTTLINSSNLSAAQKQLLLVLR